MEITNRSTSYAVFNLKLQSVFGGEEVGSVGGATLATVRAYVDAQGTEEHARKKSRAL
jgi:putative transposase